jgi:hypothetical protein
MPMKVYKRTRGADLIKKVRQERDDIIMDTAFAVRESARARAMVDTGAMQQGFAIAAGEKGRLHDDIDEMYVLAGILYTKKDDRILEQLEPIYPEKDGVAIVQGTAKHTAEWELGSEQVLSPVPMIVPAVEEQRNAFFQRVAGGGDLFD